MIRAEAMQNHTRSTGHEVIAVEGVATCSECPWQYPPTETEPNLLPIDPPTDMRSIEDAHQHIPACDDGSRYCPARDYEANPIDAPTDPEPAMGPVDETSDPGPVPTEPEVPPLNLRARIENAIDRAYGEANWERGDPLPDPAYMADIVHAEVGAGADWTPRTEGTAMTPAQALAYLLDLPEWARIDRLGRLLDQAEKASRCFTEDHDGAMQMNLALQMSEARTRDALNRIGKLCTNLDGGETDLQNMIGTIAAEALVRRA